MPVPDPDQIAPPKTSDLRLLVLGPAPARDNPSSTLFPAFLEALTHQPTPEDLSTFAGYTTHPELTLTTKYISAKITIWCDECAPPDLPEWTQHMLSPAATEVREAIGALILLLPLPHTNTQTQLSTQFLTQIAALDPLCDTIEDETARSPAKIAILQVTAPAPAPAAAQNLISELEDAVIDRGLLGWDFVLLHPSNSDAVPERNEFGEATGLPRVLEVLSGVDWSQSLTAEDEFGLESVEVGTNEDPVALQGHEFQREIADLHFALDEQQPEGDEDAARQVDQLAGLMDRVVAIREAGAGMGRDERERFAKREVTKIMREIG